MLEPPLVSQLLGTGAVILGFISAGILVHQMEKQEEEERRLQENMTRKWLELVMDCLRWGVRLKENKSARTSVGSSKALRLITNRLKGCDLSH